MISPANIRQQIRMIRLMIVFCKNSFAVIIYPYFDRGWNCLWTFSSFRWSIWV
ncbi:MAG: hypothetical protein E7038_02440 [Lentisphaerae bacterium]|nr:hypothetical protein [Lentisphaerota bacterium]